MTKKIIFFLSIAICINSLAFTQVVKTDPHNESNSVGQGNLTVFHKPNGYFNNSQFGTGVRLGAPVFAISTVNGYQFSRHYSLGLGLGIHMSVTRCGPGKAGLRVILPRADTR